MKKASYITAIAAATLGLAAASAQAAMPQMPTNLMADSVPIDQASRAIDIGSSTKYVNVTHGETVRFNANGQQFAVKFDGTPSSFPLNAFAPNGVLDHAVTVYVRPSRTDEQVL